MQCARDGDFHLGGFFDFLDEGVHTLVGFEAAVGVVNDFGQGSHLIEGDAHLAVALLGKTLQSAQVFGQLLADGDVVGLVQFDETLVVDALRNQVEEIEGRHIVASNRDVAFHLKPVFLRNKVDVDQVFAQLGLQVQLLAFGPLHLVAVGMVAHEFEQSEQAFRLHFGLVH